jgi:type III secretion protein L
MAIWLRSPYRLPGESAARVGAASDVIPAEEFGALLTIEQAYARLKADQQEAIERAKEEASALIDTARESAQQILDEARREYETAAERGYREGEQRALSEWMERLAELADSERRMQVRMRERLAQIVTIGIERIVQVQHSDALFERALEVVDRIVEGAAYVRVVVSEVDHDKACIAFERLAARWREMGRPFPLTVIADRKLPPGSCICESDFGSIDASLATQLRAMRTAITRTLKRSLIDIEDADHTGDGVTQSAGEPDNACDDSPLSGEDGHDAVEPNASLHAAYGDPEDGDTERIGDTQEVDDTEDVDGTEENDAEDPLVLDDGFLAQPDSYEDEYQHDEDTGDPIDGEGRTMGAASGQDR